MGEVKSGYRFLDHTADIGIVAYAASLRALFEVAAGALMDLITERATVRERLTRSIEIRAPEREQLLVRWLAEILLKFEIEGLVFHRFAVRKIENDHLKAEAFGEAYDAGRHPFHREIKGVTYHASFTRWMERWW